MKKKWFALLLALTIFVASSACHFEPHSLERTAPESLLESGSTDSLPPSGTVAGSPSTSLTAVEPEKLPKELLAFLTQFYPWYRDSANTQGGVFSRESAADGSSNILAYIIANPPCVNTKLYPGKQPRYHWGDGTEDPLGWWSQSQTYGEFDQKQVEWIAATIFHLTENDIQSLIEQGTKERKFYLQNGTFYTYIGGICDPFLSITITKAVTDGQKYYLAYDINWTGPSGSEQEYRGTRYAIMEETTVDGKSYWTLCEHSTAPLEN